jgi:hypothetical protein
MKFKIIFQEVSFLELKHQRSPKAALATTGSFGITAARHGSEPIIALIGIYFQHI